MEYEREYKEINERGSDSICTVAEMSLGYFYPWTPLDQMSLSTNYFNLLIKYVWSINILFECEEPQREQIKKKRKDNQFFFFLLHYNILFAHLKK